MQQKAELGGSLRQGTGEQGTLIFPNFVQEIPGYCYSQLISICCEFCVLCSEIEN